MAYLTSLGWLMVLPIALGLLLGWIVDNWRGSGYCWTLTLLTGGVLVAALEVYLAMHTALHRNDRA